MEHWNHIIGNSLCSYAFSNSWTSLLKSLCAKQKRCFGFVYLPCFLFSLPAMSYICLNNSLAWSFRSRTGLHETVASQVLSLHCSGHQKPWGWDEVMLCSQLHDVQCLPVLCKIERTVDSAQLCYFCNMLKYLADSNPKWKVNGSPAKIAISCDFQNNIFKIAFLEDSVNIS